MSFCVLFIFPQQKVPVFGDKVAILTGISMGSNKPTVKELDTRMSDLHKYFQNELQQFRQEMDKIKTPEVAVDGEGKNLETIKHRFDFFEVTMKNEIACLQSQINKLKTDFEKINSKLDGVTQNDYRNNLLLHGIEEKRNEDLYIEVNNILQSKLGIHVEKNEFNVCLRYGKRRESGNRCRPVLVSFLHGWKRNEVFRNKKQLKGTNLMCTEHLSPLRYTLFKTIKNRFGKDCWTSDCKIGFVYGNSTHYVTTKDQLAAICNISE